MNNQSATVNTTVGVAPSVTVTDAFGNPVSGQTVTFTPGVNTGTNGGVNGGAAGSTASPVTNASGVAGVASWRLGTAASTSTNNFLTVTSSGLTFVQFLATATAGAPSLVTINAGNGQTATIGNNVATAPSVLVRDAFGNPVSGATVTWGVTAGAGSVCARIVGFICQSTNFTNASGIATVVSWTVSNGGSASGTGTYANSLSATAGGSTGFTASGIWSFTNNVSPLITTTTFVTAFSSCNNCHGWTRANLVNQAASLDPGCGTLVIPSNATGSFLYQKVSGVGIPGGCGGRMASSQTGNAGDIMSAAQLTIVRDWINNGAPNN
jgi:adhesin/invasin